MAKDERLIAMDTETTGLDPATGDRIVEIGAVELVNDMPTGRKLHLYVNPERDVPAEAVKVHGLTLERLRNEPVFASVAKEFLDFIGDSRLVIHNAAFDMKFINAELKRSGHAELPYDRAIDTLKIAKQRFPTSPASLNALCGRFGVSLEKRELHGALLDSELLGEVWLGLNGGRQPEMMLSESPSSESGSSVGALSTSARQRPRALPSRVSAEEDAAHTVLMQAVEAATRKATKNQSGALWVVDADSSPSP